VKVHITLRADVCANSAAKERAKDRIIELGQLENINERRFSRYGVLSGEVSPERLAAIESLSEVASVELDGVKKALG
jgi:hypothetical protein